MARHDQRWFLAFLLPPLLFIAAGMFQQIREQTSTADGVMRQDTSRLRERLNHAGLVPREARFWKPL